MCSIIRSVDKVFNLSSNYHKGDGNKFKTFTQEHHLDAFLAHFISTNGNWQKKLAQCTGTTFQNAPYCMECLDQFLRAYKKSNMLEENINMLLSSLNIVDLLRIHIISYHAMVLPHRCDAPNSHMLGQHDWSVHSMGRLIGTIYEKMLELKEEP